MKTLFLVCIFVCTSLVPVFALDDSDSDGIPDTIDVCPQVKGVRGHDGCPLLQITLPDIRSYTTDTQIVSCVQSVAQRQSTVLLQPRCTQASCSQLFLASGVARCRYYYPALRDARGDVYPVGDLFLLR